MNFLFTLLFCFGISEAGSLSQKPIPNSADILWGKTHPKEDVVLATIGSKKITVDEFLQRSEFTIRPRNFKSKNTTLNNLISEKILALEAQRDSALQLHQGLQGQLKGIKEQFMREKLYQEEAFEKVTIDTNEVDRTYRTSLREYKVEFYVIHKKETAQRIKAVLDSVPEFSDDVFAGLEETVGKKPVHTIKYLESDDDAITQALFTNLVDTGKVIGPLKISSGDYLVMKVIDWADDILFSGEDQYKRWSKVREKIHLTKANQAWLSYVNTIMGGKKIVFDEKTSEQLSTIAFDYYMKSKQKDSLTAQVSEVPLPSSQVDYNAPFFTVDNTIWTVNDFKRELLSHPLVYRTNNLDKNNFNRQFQLAIVDMMRDHYLTKEAYTKSFDTLGSITSRVELWHDAFLSAGKQIRIMNAAFERGVVKKEDNTGRLKYWRTVLGDLQKKYSDSIRVNTGELKKLKITNIDFIALKPGVPYPAVVPNFPLLTPSENLDYIK